MYRARDAVDNDEWLGDLERAAAALDLDGEARATASALFLSTVPAADRSKPAALAASLYAGALIAGDRRSQSAVADAVGVSRLAVQDRWKDVLREAGFEPPTW
jgi:transcription initiation factor TFIIIB Brf1 subunit/transcription initiation factor TFIIB